MLCNQPKIPPENCAYCRGRACPARCLPPYPFYDSIRRGGMYPSRAPFAAASLRGGRRAGRPTTPLKNACRAGCPHPAGTYRHIPFMVQFVGEGFIPPGHLSPPQTATAARGLAALRPRLKMRVGRGALTPPQFTGVSLLRFIRREKSCPPTRGVGDAAPYNRCRQPAAISFSPTCTICTFP